MKTLYGKVLASTAVDLNGYAIPEDDLRAMFENFPDPWFMGDNHDPTKPPTCRTYNKQFKQLDSGTWAICSDVDVYDEVAFEKYGGFSITFSGACHSKNREREPEITVVLNPRAIPLEDFRDLVGLSADDLQLDVHELIEQSAGLPSFKVIIEFVSLGVLSGFLQEIGSDLYGHLKSRIKKCGERGRASHNTELQCNMVFKIEHRGNQASVLVTVRSSDLDALKELGVTGETILAHINQVAGDHDLQKVVVRANVTAPILLIEHYVDLSGVGRKLPSVQVAASEPVT